MQFNRMNPSMTRNLLLVTCRWWTWKAELYRRPFPIQRCRLPVYSKTCWCKEIPQCWMEESSNRPQLFVIRKTCEHFILRGFLNRFKWFLMYCVCLVLTLNSWSLSMSSFPVSILYDDESKSYVRPLSQQRTVTSVLVIRSDKQFCFQITTERGYKMAAA